MFSADGGCGRQQKTYNRRNCRSSAIVAFSRLAFPGACPASSDADMSSVSGFNTGAIFCWRRSSVVHHCLEKIFTPTLSSIEGVGTLFVTGVEVDVAEVVATGGGNDVLVGESHRNPGRLLRLYRKDISEYL